MADKKYQIFISSTFNDLQVERQLALKAILDLDHIPSGMEAFPAIDMEQFEYIKKVIDECDYYLLIIGARYGSTDSQGVSFTEREFDYAVSMGKTVIALLHNDIQNLPRKKFDNDPNLEASLNSFREKVSKGRMVRFWNNHDQLVAAMMQAITRAITVYPAVGWIRGDEAANDDVMQQYMRLNSSHDELLTKYESLLASKANKIEDPADLDDNFNLKYNYYSNSKRYSDEITLSWSGILKIIGPDLYNPKVPSIISNNLKSFLVGLYPNKDYLGVDSMSSDTVKIHFHAL
jgi:hypothetical protein